MLKSLQIKSLKKHYALIPLLGFVALGMGLAGFYTLRLATRNPDVSWFRKSNPEPWQEYKNKQYKFLNFTMDYSKTDPNRPEF